MGIFCTVGTKRRVCGRGNSPRRRSGPRGAFTLLEVIIATGVLTLGLGTGIIGLQLGMRDLDTARTSTAVSQVMQNEAERLRMLNWTQISALPVSANVDLASTFSGDSALSGRMTLTRTVSDVTGFSNMKEIVLQANWTGVDGKSHTRVYRMRYARGGLHDYYYSSAS